MTRAALVVAVALALLLAGAWTFQRRLVYFPDREGVPPAADVLSGGLDVVLHTADGLRLDAWYVRPRGVDRDVAVLVAPGNAGNRADRAPLAAALAGHGLSVLLVDYRGYGGNPGRPTEEGLALDARAALAFLVGEAGVPADRIVYFGESLGAAVVAELATEHPPAALVLRSPFESLAAVARVHYPGVPSWLLRDEFPVAARVRQVTAPTVVVYGGDDSIVPAEQSRAVAQAAAGPRRVVEVPGADHNDVALLTGDEVVGAVLEVAPVADR